MRITNTMMAGRMYNNITKNKSIVDKYYTQLATGKQIQYASDNPILASRVLKYRTTIAEAEQFKRNAQQGYSWLEISEQAVGTLQEMMDRIRDLAEQGANDTYDISDREKIATDIKNLMSEVGAQMNQTYGGRYVFSGYKTDIPAVFDTSNNFSYKITQDFDYTDIESFKAYSKLGLDDIAQVIDAVRIRLPYKDVMGLSFSANQNYSVTPATYAGATTPVGSDALYITDKNAFMLPDDATKSILSSGTMSIAGKPYDVVNYNTATPPLDQSKVYYDSVTKLFHLPTAVTNTYNSSSLPLDMNLDIGKLKEDPVFTVDTTSYALLSDITDTTLLAANKAYKLSDGSYVFAPSVEQDILNRGYITINGTTYKSDDIYNPPVYPEKIGSFKLPASAVDTVGAVGTISFEKINYLSSNDKYAYAPAPGTVNYIKDTGELILAKDVSDYLTSLGRDGFKINYDKAGFNQGEINPKVYFNCKDTTVGSQTEGKRYDMNNQNIEYEFGINIKISVNNLAKDMFTSSMYADFMEFCTFANNIKISERRDVELKYSGDPYFYTGDKLAKAVDDQLAEETKYARSVSQSRFESLMGTIDKYMSTISKQRTDLGSRMTRLELIESRLGDDIVSYKDLLSENEDADMSESIMYLSIAEAIYEASLKMGARIMQTSLVEYLR